MRWSPLPQRGAVALVLALLLLLAMTVAALGASRNVLRESNLAGEALLGALADAAADSGLAWFQDWCMRPDEDRLQRARFTLPGGDGSICVGSYAGTFLQEFDLIAWKIGSLPDSGSHCSTELWRVTVHGRAVAPGQMDRVFRRTREQVQLVLIPAPPPEPGP